MLTLYLNPEKSPAAVQTKVNGSPLAALKFKRGAEVPMRFVIVGSESASQLRVGIKGKNGFESDLLVFASADSGQPTEDGMAFDVVVSVASVALNDALHVGLGESLAPSSIAGMTEFSWQEGDSIRLSETIPTTVYNDIIRLASDAPEAAAGEYPAPDLVATKAWVNSLRASAEAAGLVLLETDAVLVDEYSAVALTPSGTLAIAKASQNTRGTVLLGTGERVSGRNARPVGENAAGGLAVDVSGLSAYDIAVDNGFIGTESAWLASLKGERGSKGEQGVPGEQGIQGEQGEPGEVDQDMLDAAVHRAVFEEHPETHTSVVGATDINCRWAQLSLAHCPPAGYLKSVSIPCRSGNNGEMTTSAAYLGIFQEDASGNFVHLATSTNTVSQAVGRVSVWQFENVELSGSKIRLSLMPNRTSTSISTSLVLGARGTLNDTDGCYLSNTSGASEKYVLGASFAIGIPGPVFTPAEHETNTDLHLSASERAGLAQLLAKKDALLALVN